MEHRGDFFRFTDEVVELSFSQKIELAGDVKLRAKFAARSFRNIQKSDELLAAIALVTFSDVRRNRERCTLHLILHCPISAGRKCLKNVDRKPASALPNLEIFE